MTLDLSGPKAKIERAEEHLDALYSELHTFFEPYADRRPFYHAVDGPWHVVYMRPIIEKPPLRLSIICGDAIHSLRAALDHLVWQIVLATGNEPGQWSGFPIFTDAEKFKMDVSERKKKRSPGPLHGIDPKGQAWTAIERAQPYQSLTPDAVPLAILHKLDIVDKHRTLLVHMLFPADIPIADVVSWNPAANLLDYRISTKPLSPERNTEVLRLRFSDTGLDPQVCVKDGFVLEPTFGDESTQVNADTLQLLYIEVRDIIDGFGRFVTFPSPHSTPS